MMWMYSLSLALVACLISRAHGHARLVSPPGRSSMWRYGFDTPINYNDNELFCGGFAIQWWLNNGKCGVCGDRYDVTIHDNEPPLGKYATGAISATYTENDVISVGIEVTANHRGYFEFRLCPHDSPLTTVTQECLDSHVLARALDGAKQVPVDETVVGVIYTDLQLPVGIHCTYCVLQWKYVTGNRWGCLNDDFANGPCGLGYGRQEQFYACADISILSNNGETSAPSTPMTSTVTDVSTEIIVTSPVTTVTTQTTTAAPVTCRAAGVWQNFVAMDTWCDTHCRRRYCPTTHCTCAVDSDKLTSGLLGGNKDCFSVSGKPEVDMWCKMNCPEGLCDQNTCYCLPA